jgi:hypothetical protein
MKGMMGSSGTVRVPSAAIVIFSAMAASLGVDHKGHGSQAPSHQ